MRDKSFSVPVLLMKRKFVKMNPEWQFLHYAFPCLDSKIAKGRVSEAHVSELQRFMAERNALVSAGALPRKKLLKFVFPDAFKGIRKAAEKLGCSPWDRRAIREYFLKEHNAHVDKAKGKVPEAVLRHCRVLVGRVEKTEKTHGLVIATVRYADNSVDRVAARFFPQTKQGNFVAVHLRMIVDNFGKDKP